jgi:hypothetical protein|tara:strand:+ start:843 stop:1544 length:702 start_codon:yes stop_codon:yes gene_type:complete
MPLQTSGAISLANIQTEFGGSNPISLNEYYDAASGIPASGAIDFADFYGKSSGPTVNRYGTYNFEDSFQNLVSGELNVTNTAWTRDTTSDRASFLLTPANRGSQTGSDVIIPNTAGTHFYKFVGIGSYFAGKLLLNHLVFEPLLGAPSPVGHTSVVPMMVMTGVPNLQQPTATSTVQASTGVATNVNPWNSINGGDYFGYGARYLWGGTDHLFTGLGVGAGTITVDPNYTIPT